MSRAIGREEKTIGMARARQQALLDDLITGARDQRERAGAERKVFLGGLAAIVAHLVSVTETLDVAQQRLDALLELEAKGVAGGRR